MKKLTFILSILICAFFSCAPAQQLRVTATEGINLRDAPSAEGKVLALVPGGAQVTFISETGEALTIQGATGKWTQVQWQDKQGWVFGGFLAKIEIKKSRTGAKSLSPEESAAINEQLYRAVEKGDFEKVKKILEAGADPDAREGDRTALIEASVQGYKEIARLLIDFKADVNAKEQDGRTALWNASGNGHIEIVRMLVKAGADLNVRDLDTQQTPIVLAAKNNWTEVAKILIKAGAGLGYRDHWGVDVLSQMVANDHTDIVKMLIDAGVDTKGRYSGGNTLLFDAVVRGREETLRLLINSGIDINAQNKNGSTALMEAAFWNNLDNARLLIKSRADMNIINNEGKTALMIAAERGNNEFVQMLKRAGAE